MINFDYYTNKNKIRHNSIRQNKIRQNKIRHNRGFWIRKNKCIIKCNKQSTKYW